MYITIGRIINKGKRVGFVVEKYSNNGRKKTFRLYDNQIKQLMNKGEIFDITFNNRGFSFKDSNKQISKLSIYKDNSDISTAKTISHNTSTIEYTGDNLKDFVNEFKVQELKQRDFVETILEYCEDTMGRVLSISGLRGTGKTTGILQAIAQINRYDDTVYISIDEIADMDCLDLRTLIVQKYMNKRYIFIDEITRVKDLINNSGFLADLLCTSGKRVILSGTDSLALVKADGAGLYHRMIGINVTHISYSEAKRTIGQNLGNYIRVGGLYKKEQFKNIDGLVKYIDTAVVDNICNTLTKNKGTTGLLGLASIKSKRKIRTLVFRIIYAVVYCNMQRDKSTNFKQIINLFNTSSSGTKTVKMLNSHLCKQFNIDEEVKASQKEIQALLNAMEEIGLLVKAYNIVNKLEANYYITNPSIVSHLIDSIIDILQDAKQIKKTGATLKGRYGLVFESIVVTHTKMIADKLGNNIYYYHDKDNREIDLIVEKETMDAFDDVYLYYEIKMTNNSDIAVVKSRWINDVIIDNFANLNGIIVGKGIIYNGDNKTFKGFEDPNMYASSGTTVQQIELQNMGIELISAEDYLLDPISKLQILENYNV